MVARRQNPSIWRAAVGVRFCYSRFQTGSLGERNREREREREREKTSHEHTESFRLFLSDWLAHKGDLQVAEDCTRVLAFVMAFAEAAGYKSKAGVPN